MKGAVARRSTAGCRGAIWMLVGALAAGCSLPGDKSEPPQTFLLDVGALDAPPARRPTGKTLLVATPKAAPGFDSNRIAYTREPLKLDYYLNSVWSDTPAKMLLPVLVRAFEGAGAFSAVVSPPSPAVPDLRVDLDIIRLQQELMSKPSHVRLTVRLKVIDTRSGRVLGARVFEAVESTPSEDAYGAARAANAAVQKLLGEMIPFALAYLT
ncbi:MAG: membrane integrity-associated transporter subunit PqiC [Candidatus Competibacteraceae bacterium]|nr:membrane integrity-associated transporter subunit PqiC [Candidatus Competibacteraceae bacterium]